MTVYSCPLQKRKKHPSGCFAVFEAGYSETRFWGWSGNGAVGSLFPQYFRACL